MLPAGPRREPGGPVAFRLERPREGEMDELEETLNESISGLQEVASQVKPPEAWRSFQDLTVEQFWQAWPEIRAWGEWMWQLIDAERREKASPVSDPDLDESGAAG
jgi:hypothetical protein